MPKTHLFASPSTPLTLQVTYVGYLLREPSCAITNSEIACTATDVSSSEMINASDKTPNQIGFDRTQIFIRNLNGSRSNV
jgi:hypothetical protein